MRFLLTLCGLLLVTGCAGYRLGPTGDVGAGEKSIRVAPFFNQTMQPRMGDALQTALRRQLQRDGTYRVATRGEADIIVSGVIVEYRRHELSFVPRDVLTVSDFRVTAKVHVTAREVSTGKTLVDREVSGYTLVRVGNDLNSSERQALPILADDLAKNIADILVDGSW